METSARIRAEGQPEMAEQEIGRQGQRSSSVMHPAFEDEGLDDREDENEDEKMTVSAAARRYGSIGTFEIDRVEQHLGRPDGPPRVITATVSNTLNAVIEVVTITNIVVGPSSGQVMVRKRSMPAGATVDLGGLVEVLRNR